MKNKPSKTKTSPEVLSPENKEHKEKFRKALEDTNKQYGGMLQRLANGSASDKS